MDDEWSTDGRNILSPDRLSAIRKVLATGSVIVEHWFYYGSRSPDRLVFDDYDTLLEYLTANARPKSPVTIDMKPDAGQYQGEDSPGHRQGRWR